MVSWAGRGPSSETSLHDKQRHLATRRNVALVARLFATFCLAPRRSAVYRRAPQRLEAMNTFEDDRGTHQDSGQLNGWKEISAYIGKGVRQAQRWEKLGMPVHRVGGMDGVVYASRTEIDQWRRSAAGQDAEQPSRPDEPCPESETPPALDPPPAPSKRWARSRWIALAALGAFAALGFGGYRYLASPPLDMRLHSPAEAGQGGTFRFAAAGGDPELKLAYRVLRNPRGGEHLVSPAVPRGADGQFEWAFSTDCQTPPGRHEIGLADSGGAALTARVAVMVKENPVCEGPVPDLQVENITISVDQVVAGAELRGQFSIRNQGARTASPSTTRLRLAKSPMRSSPSDIRLGDIPAPILRPGEESVFDPVIVIPPSTEPGVYYVWVVLDNNGDNVESFTHNNYARSIPIVVTRPPS